MSKNVFFENEKFKILNADVTKDKLFCEEFIDLIVTSPPYNVSIDYNSNNDQIDYNDYLKFTRKWLSNCYKWTKNHGRLLLNVPLDKNKNGHQSVGADITNIAKSVGWKYMSTIVWNEGNISRRTAWGSWLSASAPNIIAPVELIIILYKGTWKKETGSKISDISKQEFMDWTLGIWTFPGESKKRIGHPAPFPRELPKRCIKLFSYVGDVVFDPFLGSGTTIIEAINQNRKAVGVDIDENYCKLSLDRIINELGVFMNE